MLRIRTISGVFLTLTVAVGANAADGVPPVDAIQKQLTSLYQTAKATADGTDLVTAGSVLVLQKDHLVMSKVEQPFPTPNTYKNGSITQNGLVAAGKFFQALGKLGAGAGGDASAAPVGNTREFVAGEKFWVVRIDTRADGVTMALLSDPIKDIRYHAVLRFPFAKGASPTPDDVASTVSEVIKIDEQDNSTQSADNQSGGTAAPAQTKTISIGQTRDQVIAMFGVPAKVVHLGAKEIDFFTDMKVTFMQDKVVDVK